MKQKSETLQMFKRFLADASQTEWTVKRLRTDNRKEYVNQEFKNYLIENGIVHELTSTYTPALNGIAERENRTLVEMARAILITKELPLRLWAEAVNTAAYITNRVPSRKETDTTPYEQWLK
jgi:transposase InsO family protein